MRNRQYTPTIVGNEAIAVIASSRAFSATSEAQQGRPHPQGVHRWDLGTRRFLKDVHGDLRERSPLGQRVRERSELDWFGQPVVQKQVRHFLERGVGSDVLDGVSGDRQPSSFAVNVAEPGGGSHDTVKALGHQLMFLGIGTLVNIHPLESLPS